MGFYVNAVAQNLLVALWGKSPYSKGAHNNARKHIGEAGTHYDVIVAIIMHKGWEQVVSALAVLSCHATYIPIDAKWPAKRATQIIEASGAAAVLTTQALVEGWTMNFPSSPRWHPCGTFLKLQWPAWERQRRRV